MTQEEAQRRQTQEGEHAEVNAHNALHHHHIPPKERIEESADAPMHSPRNEYEVEKTLDKAQKSADRQTSDKGRKRSEEEDVPDRTLMTYTNEARLSTTLPIVQEVGENSSRHSSRSEGRQPSPKPHNDTEQDQHVQQSETSNRILVGEQQYSSPKLMSREDLQSQKRSEVDPEHDQSHSRNDGNGHQTVEYIVTTHESGQPKAQYEMEAPISSESVNEVNVWPIEPEDDQQEQHRQHQQRISKPPRIESGIIPTLGPLIAENEIGIAR